MDIKILATLVYGLLISFGGIMGYVVSGSKPSLISGLIAGLTLIVGSILMRYIQSVGLIITIFMTILIILFFAWKLFQAISGDSSIGRPVGILILSFAELAVLYFFKNNS